MSTIYANQSHGTDRQWPAWMLAARASDEAAYDALLNSCVPLIWRMARKPGVRSHLLRSGSFGCATAAADCRPGSLRVSWHRALAALRARMIRSEHS